MRRRTSAVAALLLVAGVGACSDGTSDERSEQPGSRAGEQVEHDGQDEPVDEHALVDLTGVRVSPVPAGNGVPNQSATRPDAAEPLPEGYREDEYLLAGAASVYSGPVTGPVTVASRGHQYATRILVRAPAAASDFSGTVWVEPFNTTIGPENDVIWSALAPLIRSRGDAWVGVTVRAAQVGRHQEFDPARYADLDLDDNAYGWDVLRTIGAVLKTNDPQSPLAGAGVEHVYLGGYSQSAVDTATFVTAFHDRTRLDGGGAVYDGYLVGARESNLSPLQSGDTIIPQFERAPLPPVDVPVVDIEPQTDVQGFAVEVPTELARQEGFAGAEEIETPTFEYVNVGGATVRRDDNDTPTDRYRLYEIAGAPHSRNDETCDGESTFPTRAFVRAAAAHLARWAEEGVAPPTAPRIELERLDEVSVAATDEYGNARGGVRSPFVDVPLFTYQVHTGPGPLCVLAGSESPLPADVLLERYGDADTYLAEFTASLDATIEAGFLLELDRQAILDTTRASAAEVFGAITGG